MQRGSRSQTNRESVFVKCGARSVRWQMIAAKAPLASLASTAVWHKLVWGVMLVKWPNGRLPPWCRPSESSDKPAQRKRTPKGGSFLRVHSGAELHNRSPVAGYRTERLVALKSSWLRVFFRPKPAAPLHGEVSLRKKTWGTRRRRGRGD